MNNVNLQNNNGDSPLYLAIFHNYQKIAKEILKTTDINVNLQNNYGYTALMIAFTRNSKNIVEQLLDINNINVNLQDKNGNTALMIPFSNITYKKYYTNGNNTYGNNIKYISHKLLDRDDINVNLQDKNGNTVLMLSIVDYKKESIIIDELLKRDDIDLKLKNKNGQTALDLCKKYNLPKKYQEAISKVLYPPYLKYNLPEFIDYINEIIRKSANKKNKNSNINNNVYNAIIQYLKYNYKLISLYNNGQYSIEPIKSKELLTIANIFNSNQKYNFYKKISVVYKNNIGMIAGINIGGITRNFFFECQQ